MHRRCGGDVHVVDAERITGLQLGDLDLRAFREQVVVLDPVADVVLQGVDLALDESRRTDWTVDLQDLVLSGSNPVGGDHVVERTDVVAVQVRDQHTAKEVRQRSRGRHPHHDTSTGVDQDVRVTRLREG